MFTVFDLKNSVPLSGEETAAVWRVLDDYSRTAAGAWLRGFPFRRFELRWCPAMTDDVTGAFLPSRPWTVYLMPPDAKMDNYARIAWAEYITSTVIHELRHAWQFRRRPLLYVLCCLPVLRKFTLERDARRIGGEAETIVFNTIGWHTKRSGNAATNERNRNETGTCRD